MLDAAGRDTVVPRPGNLFAEFALESAGWKEVAVVVELAVAVAAEDVAFVACNAEPTPNLHLVNSLPPCQQIP